MLKDEFLYHLKSNFPFPPTTDQDHALNTFSHFAFSQEEQSVMVIRGSAGTGKTFLASVIVKTLRQMRYNITLLAPTKARSR